MPPRSLAKKPAAKPAEPKKEEQKKKKRRVQQEDPADEDEQEQEQSSHESSSGAESGGEQSESGSDNGEEGAGSDEEEVQVSFEFFDPRPEDFWAVKNFVARLLDGAEFHSGELADIIVAQKTVGTLVRVAEGFNEVYGVISVVNLQQHREATCVQQLKAFLLKRCPDAGTREKLSRILEGEKGKRTGLVVNERVVNIPPELVPPLHRALHDEIAWATEDEPTQELRDNFKLDYYVMITRVVPGGAAVGEGEGSSAGGKKGKKKGKEAPGVMYVRVEDEVYHQEAALSFTYEIAAASGSGEADITLHSDEPQVRLAMVIHKDRIPRIRERLEALFPNAAPDDEEGGDDTR